MAAADTMARAQLRFVPQSMMPRRRRPNFICSFSTQVREENLMTAATGVARSGQVDAARSRLQATPVDNYVLAFIRTRFDQSLSTKDGQQFKLAYDGASVRVPFGPALSPENRRLLDEQAAIVVDVESRHVMYYETLDDMENEWGVFAGVRA